jgi:hypothetical protein
MVDLAFLLITFFMLTTTLSKPQSMPLGLPDLEDGLINRLKLMKIDHDCCDVGDNDKMVYYMGLLATLLVQLIFLMEKRFVKNY